MFLRNIAIFQLKKLFKHKVIMINLNAKFVKIINISHIYLVKFVAKIFA